MKYQENVKTGMHASHIHDMIHAVGICKQYYWLGLVVNNLACWPPPPPQAAYDVTCTTPLRRLLPRASIPS